MDIPGYERLEEIGRGGYAIVFRAYQPAFGRSVAIKVLTSAGMTQIDQERFAREALAMGRLSWHPNIVVVHDTGVTELGHPYLVMEYLEGGSLGEKLREGGRLPLNDAVGSVIGLSAAVHTAHEGGLLHRDVKPDNALLDAFGKVKLADFGIAAVTGSTLTASGLVTATVAHAAPEVLNGQKATAAADVYSLGSTLFELLSGTSAFGRATDESIVPLVVRATSDPVPDLRAQGVPDEIARVVEWAMVKEPIQRPASALEFGRSLQSAQELLDLPVTDLPVRSDAAHASERTISRPVLTPQPATPVPTPPPSTPVIPPPPGGPTSDPPTGPSPPSRDRRRMPAAIGAVVVALLAAGAFLALRGGDDGGASGGGSAGGDRPEQGQGGQDRQDGDGSESEDSQNLRGPERAEPELAESFAVPNRPFRVAATDDAVWVTNSESTTVTRLDPASGEIVATVDIGGEPVGVAATRNAVWVTNFTGSTVHRINPKNNRVAEVIPVAAGPRNVLVAESGIWVPGYEADAISRIDSKTNRVMINIPVGAGPRGAAEADDGSIWISNSKAGTVSRIDPETNSVIATVDVGGFASGIVATPGSVWVTDADSETLIRVNSETGEVVDRIAVAEDPGGLDAADGEVWVATSAVDSVSRIDAETGEVTLTLDVGDAPGGLDVFGGSLWVAETEADRVSRVALA